MGIFVCDFSTNKFMEIDQEMIKKLSLIGTVVNENVLDRFPTLEKCNSFLASCYSFYLKIFHKYEKIKNRMKNLREEQIRSTGIELMDLLVLLKENESPCFSSNKMEEDISILLYDCMLLEICYKGTSTFFNQIQNSKFSFAFLENLIKNDLNKEDFVVQDLDEDILSFLGEKKIVTIKEKYISQLHSYEALNREYEQENRTTFFKIKEVKKRRNKICLQQGKKWFFTLFFLGVVNLSVIKGAFAINEEKEMLQEQLQEDEGFLLSHHFFFSSLLFCDLLVLYIFNRKMKSGSLGKDRKEIEKIVQDLELSWEREEKERKYLYYRLAESHRELVDTYERLPKSIKDDNELILRMHSLEKGKRKSK